VVDTGKYQHAVATGQLDRRPMFTAFDRDHIIWPDGTQEKADTVLFATGYARPTCGHRLSAQLSASYGVSVLATRAMPRPHAAIWPAGR
jgi:hypothetical protein